MRASARHLSTNSSHGHQIHQMAARALASGRSVVSKYSSGDDDSTYDANDAALDASNRPRMFNSKSSNSARGSSSRKLQNSSTKQFNLLAASGSGEVSAEANGENGTRKRSAAKQPQEWRHRPSHYTAFRPNGNKKWWKEMDRASFRKLLDECMAVGKVSSVLRKYMDEFPILDNTWSDQELVLIVGALIKMNRSQVALDVLRNQFKEPDRNRLNRVAAESARLGNAQVALGILDIAKHFNMEPDVITYTSAIHACARGGRADVPTALQLLNEMIQDGITPNHRTYGAAVLAYARLNRWEEIEDLMDAIPYTDDGNKSAVFASAIITCTRNRQYLFATRLFKMLLDQGIYPGDNLCNAALSACARTSDLHHLNVIFKLVEIHATPTIYTFNSMISAYGNARDMDEALRVHRVMKARGVQPDVVTFNALLLGAVRSRRVELVPQILSMMAQESAKWDVYTLNMLLEACVLTGDAAQAEAYVSMATNSKEEDKSKQQSVRLDRTHFETLMNVYFVAKQYEKVISLWRDNYVCRRRTKSSKALNFLIRACKETADDTTAVALLEEFTARGHVASSVTHNHLLATFLAADKVDAARTHLAQMEADGLATTFSFTLLMKHLLLKSTSKNSASAATTTTTNHEQLNDVLAIFNAYLEARDNRAKWNNPLLHFPTDAIYVLAARAAKQLGAHDDLLEIYHECPVTTAVDVKKEIAKLAIASCDDQGDWKAAVLLYDELTPKLDTETNIALYEHVVKIVARAGEFEQALDVNGGDWYRLNRTDRGWGF
ncbi:Ppr repeat protein, partial [Globisporangium splendens]